MRAIATHRGFNYPRRHEYENDGRRAFLRPALASKEGEVIDGLEQLLDRLVDRHGFN